MTKGYELISFLRYNEEATAPTVLQTLLFQLVALDADLRAALCSELRSSTRDRKRDLKSSTAFAADTLLKLIKCAPSPVYIIVDGLDEFEDPCRHLILDQLLSLGVKVSGEAILKLFIGSRREEGHPSLAVFACRTSPAISGTVSLGFASSVRKTQLYQDA